MVGLNNTYGSRGHSRHKITTDPATSKYIILSDDQLFLQSSDTVGWVTQGIQLCIIFAPAIHQRLFFENDGVPPNLGNLFKISCLSKNQYSL